MLKKTAIDLLGGSIGSAAQAIGITYQAVVKWPDELPSRIADRVYAALWKMKHAGGLASETPTIGPILFIRAEWDAEAAVWVATSDDVPGLATEAATLEALEAKLHTLVPELLDANGCPGGPEVPFELLARRLAVAHRQAQ